MALTIDSTKGGTDANSYATEQEADDYLDALYGADEWASLSSDNKKRLLMTATQQIDGLSLEYEKLADTQALNFPVDTGDPADDGWEQIQEACILQAFYLFLNSDVVAEARSNSIQGVTSESIKGLSKNVMGFNSMRKYHPRVLKILVYYLDLSFNIFRG